ncbi:hypothetical protein BX589_101203 [Paraburkholderia fungorum]|uniref:hypothetical protein n=1 Tax=Paraburkholderia fungorum TaxID=134537 RepID=UPI000D05300E|nr:hypothetical protein [Paraburkholderia fungorum]PRZ56553.1 hypothetical protein BX589_101203 [Paraburkholderia fungorum]
MNSATWVKFLAGVLLFAAWFVLVLMRIVPPGPLVDAIGYALVGLGIYHATSNSSSPSTLLASLLARVTPAPASGEAVTAPPSGAATAPAQPSPTEPALSAAPLTVSASGPVTVAAPAVSAAGTLQ